MSTSNNSNQQTLADSRANERPPMLERGNYIPWESRLRRFLDNKLKEGERMWNLIQNGPYVRPLIPDPDSVVNINSTVKQILEPLFKMTKGNKNQYIADVKVMNYHLQEIPNDYIQFSGCHVKTQRKSKEGESLESVYEILTTLVNIMDHNNVRPISVSINTKFLNCLQPEWRKYVTMVRHNQTGEIVSYDMLYDSLVQFEPHVLASKAKKVATNHDPLALIAHSNASSPQSHAHSSYSPQPYYVTHPSSVVDYEDEYQGELQGDSQEDKLTTAMMLLARASLKSFVMVAMRVPRTESTPGKTNVQCYNCNEKGHYARDCQKPRVCDANLVEHRVQPADGNAETVPSYDAKAISKINASSKVHEQMHHEKRKNIIQTSNDDQIDSNIIFDDPYVENNGGTSNNDSNDHDEYHKI
ncbi:retrovirus-related pol polyprotein from transposon TNT 1-94 [Tanacetum coccineum]